MLNASLAELLGYFRCIYYRLWVLWFCWLYITIPSTFYDEFVKPKNSC